MAQQSEAKILFLFEDEIRTAAAALEVFVKINEAPEDQRSADEWREKLADALQACHGALHNAHDTAFSLVLCPKNMFKKKAKGGAAHA